MAFPKYGTHPIKCGSGKCKWVGYETEQTEAPGEISGVETRENVCPKCGHNTYEFMTEKQMKKTGLTVKT